MSRPRSKDNVITPFDRLAHAIRTFKVSAETQKTLEDIARKSLKSLASAYLDKTLSKTKVGKIISNHSKKVAREIGKEIKVKFKF